MKQKWRINAETILDGNRRCSMEFDYIPENVVTNLLLAMEELLRREGRESRPLIKRDCLTL